MERGPRLEDDPAFGFAEFAANLRFEGLPGELVAQLERVVLDTLGTTLAGATLGLGCREIVEVVRAGGGAPESTLLGYGDRIPAPMAALANGAMAHALNYDDVYPGGGHLGVVTIPAALAVAERRGSVSGREFLAALAAGAEIAARLQAAVRRVDDGTSEAKPQPTQMLGVFAAAASAGRVLRFDRDHMLSALGLALMQANGNRQPVVEGTPAKAVYAAFPNFGGVLGALLAEAGLRAGCAVFEGEAGFFPTFYGNRYDHAALVDGLGHEYFTLDVGFKPWPTTARAHPFIEAALHLAREHDLQPDEVAHVEVRGGPHMRVFCEPLAVRLHPHSSVEAEDNIFFGVFKALANRTVTLADFQPDGLRQPAIQRLAERASYAIDDTLGHAGVVEVALTTGEHVSHRVEHALGDRDHPLDDDALVAKFVDCAQHAPRPLSRSTLDAVVDRIFHLDQVPDMRVLAPMVSGGEPSF
jgi:2-methylcitrate dehydratase PrpD